VLEHRVAVTETTLRGIQRENAAVLQVDGVQGLKAVLQLDAVGSDVLNGRRAHGARNQGQVLQTRQALGQCPLHKSVPIDAGTRLHYRGFGALLYHAAPLHF